MEAHTLSQQATHPPSSHPQGPQSQAPSPFPAAAAATARLPATAVPPRSGSPRHSGPRCWARGLAASPPEKQCPEESQPVISGMYMIFFARASRGFALFKF